ncbi:hypothetical protein LRU_00100 [Ligilactobacillus ruminis SPM0211]|uniref:Uncharacterized protein n=1 Tax=Ligilactobacillus ruminis SPM0211 TaxID=1040964 RepID=F7QXE6_9LACO|nr:hypothetical protein LRU_00100 [Ligilactobacillus ruminis SPM0211]
MYCKSRRLADSLTDVSTMPQVFFRAFLSSITKKQ